MLKNKRILIGLLVTLMILILPSIVKAEETQSAQVELNGVTANFTYTLNEAGAIENLKCTNASDLKGAISIPSKIHDKNVVAIGNNAFKGGIGITEVTIPSSVKEIEYSAFENCTSLSKVNLGSIENISFDVFKGCTSLKSIKIPKTLKHGATVSCLNNSNITSITFEEGLTVIPSYLCANTGITEVTIPSSVKEIEHDAFENCTSLSKVNLGSIENISFDVFKGCTSLKSIKIPKTLKHGATVSCLNNSNITSITFEEGLTVIPSYLCANTGITEVTIPSSVTEIEYYAFKDCKNLKKITILDNVKKMGWFLTQPNTDSVFTNHSDDLTIYCYEGSTAASYAVNTKIKYVFLKKPANSGTSDKQDEVSNVGKDSNTGTKDDTTKKDTTIATAKLPNTGKVIIAWVIGIVAVSGITAHIRYKKLYF